MEPTPRVDYQVIVAKNDDPHQWEAKHTKIVVLLGQGYIIQTSHMVTDMTSLIVYYFMTKTS